MTKIISVLTLTSIILLNVDAFVPKNDIHKTRILQTGSQSRRRFSQSTTSVKQKEEDIEEVDVIVIGAGIGGLSCAALSARYGLKTLCLETHDTPGGCAHSFSRYSTASKEVPFRFDAGPSLVTGLSSASTNPLRQVLDAIGTADDIEWKTYDGWVVHDYSDGTSFRVTTSDGGEFEQAIEEKAGPASREAFEEFRSKILSDDGGLAKASASIPPFALRGGLAAVASLFPYLSKLLSIGPKGLLLTGPFSNVMDLYGLKDPFVRKWFDYLSFALSGLDASNTQGAPVAYMMGDIHKHGAVLDYPVGGMDSIVRALVSGMERNGGELRLNSCVDRMLLATTEGDGAAKCVGVALSSGRTIRAREGVVSNTPLWNYARMLEDSVAAAGADNDDDSHRSSSNNRAIRDAVEKVRKQADGMNTTRSFMHLHLGIPRDGLPDDLECHHSMLDFDLPVTDEQNMVIISIPTVFDPALAPPGYHIVHAYTAASDNFEDWEPYIGEETGKGAGHSPNSGKSQAYNKKDGYNELKEAKAEVLWKAIECVVPDVRERAKKPGSIALVGTPLTHRRYNQRYRGAYGPGINHGKKVWELAGATTPIRNLYACGDTSFPGIGLPGVAASGTIAANSMVPVAKQRKLMNELRNKGALQ